jgi:uncharacterized integral membrane protein (TIGR00697 family)
MYNQKLFFLLAVYIAALFASNLLGMKTMPFFFGTHLSVAVFFIPILFLTTDIVGQTYGKELSKKFVYAGFLALIFFTLGNLLANTLPWSEITYTRIGEAYDTVFGLSWRIGLASLFAFFASEYVDVVTFFLGKKIWNNFFFASTFSNIISQAIDTAVFMSIAFLGVFSPEKILMMAIPWWIYKVLGGVLYTPVSYFILSLLRKWSPHR